MGSEIGDFAYLLSTTEAQRHREGCGKKKNSVSLSLCVP